MKKQNIAIENKYIGHLGLVANTIDELDIVNLIDKRLPLYNSHDAKLTIS